RLTLQELGEEYRKRWGIETDYRVMKNEFLALTTSNNPTVRLYYLYLAVLMRNYIEFLRYILNDSSFSFPGYLSIKLLKRIVFRLDDGSDPENVQHCQPRRPGYLEMRKFTEKIRFCLSKNHCFILLLRIFPAVL
ncbi:MAG: hypothetical protein CVT47_04195, partial [Thermoplasmata archaeon HGW-Thermoplasmata-2]